MFILHETITCQACTCHVTLQWRHDGRDDVSNHQPQDCLVNRLFGRRSNKTSKQCVTGLCAGNSPRTSEFRAQMASNAENVSIWWSHHELSCRNLYSIMTWSEHHCNEEYNKIIFIIFHNHFWNGPRNQVIRLRQWFIHHKYNKVHHQGNE